MVSTPLPLGQAQQLLLSSSKLMLLWGRSHADRARAWVSSQVVMAVDAALTFVTYTARATSDTTTGMRW